MSGAIPPPTWAVGFDNRFHRYIRQRNGRWAQKCQRNATIDAPTHGAPVKGRTCDACCGLVTLGQRGRTGGKS